MKSLLLIRSRGFGARILTLALLAMGGIARADLAAGVQFFNAEQYSEAFAAFKPDADDGNAVAQYALGLLYASGLGVKRDEAEAERYYLLAAQQNQMRAQNNLGQLYLLSNRESEAMNWFRRSAALGGAIAAYNLGITYERGYAGNPPDPVQARIWHQQAGDLGYSYAQYRMGLLLENGVGGNKDLQQALYWYDLSANQGNIQAKAAADRLRLTVPRATVPTIQTNLKPISSAPVPVTTPGSTIPTPAMPVVSPTPDSKTLWILTVGVNRYPNYGDSATLDYSVKDAQDISAFFASQAGRNYQQVNRLMLLNEKATIENIRSSMRTIETQAGTEDSLIVFFSGHGTLENGDYYILTANSDPLSPAQTMVTEKELVDFFSKTQAKTLLLLDTCHSGKTTGSKARSVNSLIKTRAVGVVSDQLAQQTQNSTIPKAILAATTGNQLAFENPQWDNGVFTKSLIEALKGQYQEALPSKVLLSDVVKYVDQRVASLTDEKQTPTTKWDGQDWVLSRP